MILRSYQVLAQCWLIGGWHIRRVRVRQVGQSMGVLYGVGLARDTSLQRLRLKVWVMFETSDM